jgi:hypothetical protein
MGEMVVYLLYCGVAAFVRNCTWYTTFQCESVEVSFADFHFFFIGRTWRDLFATVSVRQKVMK